MSSKVEQATNAVEGKAKEIYHAAKKEENKAIAKDSNVPLGDRISAACGVVSEKVKEMAGKGEHEANISKLEHSDKIGDTVNAAKGAVEGKAQEIKHSALKEGYKAQAKDSNETLTNRVAAVGHAASEKLSEMAAKTKHEANMEELRH
jgi:phosphoribosylaminoimidazole-succinocarboxamide synthase